MIRFYYQVLDGPEPGWKTAEMPAEGVGSYELAILAAEEFAHEQMRSKGYGKDIGAITLAAAPPII